MQYKWKHELKERKEYKPRYEPPSSPLQGPGFRERRWWWEKAERQMGFFACTGTGVRASPWLDCTGLVMAEITEMPSSTLLCFSHYASGIMGIW